jgi:DNA-directed RNA polymerase specialized sigma24 family protein
MALAGGASQAEAARDVGVSKSTVQRRLADERFRERLELERTAMLQQGRGRLMAGVVDAVEALREIAANGQSESARVAASRAIVDLTIGARRFELNPFRPEEVRRVLDLMLVRALERLPEDSRDAFLDDMARLASASGLR